MLHGLCGIGIGALVAITVTSSTWADDLDFSGRTTKRDLNGDGIADFVATSPFGDGAGAWGVGLVEVTDGATLTKTRVCASVGAVDPDFFGYSVSTAHDFNKDGFVDVVIGAPGEATRGVVYVFHGPIDTSRAVLTRADADLILYAPTDEAMEFGRGVAPFTDWNGNGTSDIRVRCSMVAFWGESREATFVFDGRSGEFVGGLAGREIEQLWYEEHADLDDDGDIDTVDLLDMLAQIGQIAVPGEVDADLDDDGRIGARDLQIQVDRMAARDPLELPEIVEGEPLSSTHVIECAIYDYDYDSITRVRCNRFVEPWVDDGDDEEPGDPCDPEDFRVPGDPGAGIWNDCSNACIDAWFTWFEARFAEAQNCDMPETCYINCDADPQCFGWTRYGFYDLDRKKIYICWDRIQNTQDPCLTLKLILLEEGLHALDDCYGEIEDDDDGAISCESRVCLEFRAAFFFECAHHGQDVLARAACAREQLMGMLQQLGQGGPPLCFLEIAGWLGFEIINEENMQEFLDAFRNWLMQHCLQDWINDHPTVAPIPDCVVPPLPQPNPDPGDDPQVEDEPGQLRVR